MKHVTKVISIFLFTSFSLNAVSFSSPVNWLKEKYQSLSQTCNEKKDQAQQNLQNRIDQVKPLVNKCLHGAQMLLGGSIMTIGAIGAYDFYKVMHFLEHTKETINFSPLKPGIAYRMIKLPKNLIQEFATIKHLDFCPDVIPILGCIAVGTGLYMMYNGYKNFKEEQHN